MTLRRLWIARPSLRRIVRKGSQGILDLAPAVALGLAIFFGLTQCSYAGPDGSDYWTLTHQPVPVTDVREVESPCGLRIDGCFYRVTGVIEIRRGMPAGLRQCVLTHEKKHAEGYTHPIRIQYATDCGDGTMWVTMERR